MKQPRTAEQVFPSEGPPGPRHPSLLLPSFLLLFACLTGLLFGSTAFANLTPFGIGGGGFLQAALFHPTDDNYILIGGDVGGIWRSTDGGATWATWNAGLNITNHEGHSYYVDDLVAVDNAGVTFYAATRGGIWKAPDNGSWEQKSAGFYREAGKPRGAIIPFSSLDWNEDDLLVAGAGYSRLDNPDSELTRYPGVSFALDNSDPGLVSEKYTVWTLDPLNANAEWTELPNALSTEQSARDITVRTYDIGGIPTDYIAVVTREGVYVHDGSVWNDFTPSWYGPSGTEPADSETAWTVHLSERKTIYITRRRFADEFGTTGGVYCIPDVTTSSDPANDWLLLEDPNARTPSTKFDFVLLTVVDGTGTAPDTLYLSGTPARGEIFRAEYTP